MHCSLQNLDIFEFNSEKRSFHNKSPDSVYFLLGNFLDPSIEYSQENLQDRALF